MLWMFYAMEMFKRLFQFISQSASTDVIALWTFLSICPSVCHSGIAYQMMEKVGTCVPMFRLVTT